MVDWINDNKYAKYFFTTLKEASREEPELDVDNLPDDEEVWNSRNEKLKGKLDVEGLPPEQAALAPEMSAADVSAFTNDIDEWKSKLQEFEAVLDDMYTKSAQAAVDPNGAIMYSKLANAIESMQMDIGKINGILRTLGTRIETTAKLNAAENKKQ